MPTVSISSEISLLPADKDKRYDTMYKDVGFELGFGRAGSYRGHSHLQLVDIIFSPFGIRVTGGISKSISTLVIAPARTYLPDLVTGDFMFIKFCPDSNVVHLPDKVDDRLSEQQILVFKDRAHLIFPWHARPHTEPEIVELSLQCNELSITLGLDQTFVFGK